MTGQRHAFASAVRGRVDAEGRLVEADPPLAGLQLRAGGEEGGPLAVPQIASLARLSRRLGIVISRSVLAADGETDLDLWIRAQPEGDGVELSITGWNEREARTPTGAAKERAHDFERAVADWSWETDEALRFTAISSEAAAAAGKSAEFFIGKPLTRLFRFAEDREGTLPILAALAEQRSFHGQAAELKGGSDGRYLLSGVPLIDGAGRFTGFRGSASSVVEGEYEPLPSLEERGAAVDAVAFGERLDRALREPLDNIIANAETLGSQLEGPLRRDYANYASDIATAGRHLLSLVDDLVDLQSIERADFRPEAEAIDLADLARRTAGLMSVRAAARNVQIDRPSAEESMPATGDFKRTLQILMNLIANAIRYSPEGGMVWIRTDREDDLACVLVADQGKGIAEEDQARIFEKFERVDPNEPGGTGLGLYIARRLARAMGGEISVDSAPGKGARFTLTLPYRKMTLPYRADG
jgi:signal transduction histidine kinase